MFYDRVRNTVPSRAVPSVLAHVLVHEITHILQGTSRHSVSGVMKAQWDGRDYRQMEQKPLGFTEEDIRFIQQGLTVQVIRAGAEGNTEAAMVTAK